VKLATVFARKVRDNSLNITSERIMNSRLRAIRELFPFSQTHPDRTAAEVRDRLDSVSGLSSYEVVVELTLHVIPSIVKQPNLHSRLQLLEEALEEAEKALPVLDRHIDYSELPLPHAATTSALAADNLIKKLASGYHGIATDISAGTNDLGRLLQRSIRRAMTLIARRQQLAYRTYAKPSASSWLMLHDLYRMARNYHRRMPEESIAHVEHMYLSSLLLAYLEPGKLARSDLPAAIFCTQQLARHALVSDVTAETKAVPHGTAGFLVRPEEGNAGTPLHRLVPGTPIASGMLIDCTRVLEAIEKSAKRSPEETPEPELGISQNLLHTLQIAISGKSTRRFDRKRFQPRADLVGGIAQVIPFLEGSAHSRRFDDSSLHNGQRAFVPSEWSLIDQSPDGFLVRFMQGDKWRVGVGNIIALQPRESGKVHVCLVRRIATTAQGLLELGLQMLSPEVSVIDLPGHAERRRGICLHSLPGHGGRPGVIARPGHLASGYKLRLVGNQLWMVGRRIEGSEGLEIFTLLPLPG
jgi:hypothetical protein